MLDPVITPSGISYEKSAISQHIAMNGNYDPVTRETCKLSDLRPNLALKEYIETWLEANPWGYEKTAINGDD